MQVITSSSEGGAGQLVQGPFCRISWHPINLNSSDQVKQYLLSVGWKPDEWNYKTDKNGRPEYNLHGEKIKTSPKLTESSYESVAGEIPSLVARRNILVHRQRLLKNTRRDGEETGWLNQLREDGRLTAGAIPLATNTHRFRHTGIVNVPSAGTVYGEEIRSLFTAAPGKVLVGGDAAALEARIQGHFVYPFKGGKELAELVIEGDIHQANSDMWGCTRKEAKSPLYCLLYGGQAPKLAETMGCSITEAQEHYDSFWGTYTALAQFRDAITEVWKKRGGKNGGFLRALNGAKLFARSPHSLVNLMFQSGGSISVKLAMVLTDKWVTEFDLDSLQILSMHDEFTHETHPPHALRVKALMEKSFSESGKYFKLNVPLLGDVHIGDTWGDCH